MIDRFVCGKFFADADIEFAFVSVETAFAGDVVTNNVNHDIGVRTRNTK